MSDTAIVSETTLNGGLMGGACRLLQGRGNIPPHQISLRQAQGGGLGFNA